MACHLKTLQLLLSLLLSSCIIFIRGEQIAYTWKGSFKGTTLTTRNGRSIEAYLGIPYAEPPIGPLRFRSPVEVEYFDDIRDATVDGNQCLQLNDANEVVGDEDCLYLNIYTPGVLTEVDSDKDPTLFPTMVYIHDGDFVKGNGSSMIFGPQYLLDKDVVLVTINYRLGVLGFLSTGDSEAPGNFGLKDQVLALKWINDNIAFFAGDQDRVTLFGNGAGGVSAQLHSISHLSDGLFKQYISQSGTANCFWAFNDKDESKEYAKKLGRYLNCPTINSRALIDCLRMVDSYNLVDSNDIFDNTFYHFNTWGPTEEPYINGAFLTEYPSDKFLSGREKDYPSMIGHVADEGLIFTAQWYSNDDMYEKIMNNLDDFLLNIIQVSFDILNPEKYVTLVKYFYFNGTVMKEKDTFLKNMTNLLSDTTFLLSGAYIEESILIKWFNYTTYLYSFDYRGTFSKTSNVIGSNENIGVTHGDELTYLFPASNTQFDQPQLELSESDEQVIDTIIDLWTSFADTGTPSTKRFPDANYWQPYKNSSKYLIIGDNSDTSLRFQDNFREERMSFWIALIYDQFYGAYSRFIMGYPNSFNVPRKLISTPVPLRWNVVFLSYQLQITMADDEITVYNRY